MATDETWRTEEINSLFAAILRLETVPEAEQFFRDLCTLGELRDMAQRWAVVRMLDQGLHYAEISGRTGASTATITRIASWLHHGEGGYRLMLERVGTAPAAGDAVAAGNPPTGAPGPSDARSPRPGGIR